MTTYNKMKYLKLSLLTPIFTVALLLSCKEEEKQVVSFTRPIKYEKVGVFGGEKVRTFSGTAKTEKIVNLSFRGQGIITQLDLKIGQQVKKGALLGKLDNVQSRLNYETAISSLNSNTSQMNTAKLNLNRIRILYEKGGASLSDFETAKNSYITAKQGFESAKRSVAIQADQVKYGYLYAPENGIISAVNVEVDENIQAGTKVAVLNSGVDMEITLGLPESVINNVKSGMDVTIGFSALEDKKYQGKVTEVSPAVDPNTATYPARVTLNNPSEEIKSGMAANVTFDFGTHVSDVRTPLVPAHAVGEDSDGNFVFLVVESGEKATVKKQPVTVGDLSSNGFAITKGLKEGQKIATAGLQTLLDGQEVLLNDLEKSEAKQ